MQSLVFEICSTDATPTTILSNGQLANQVAFEFIYKKAFQHFNKREKKKNSKCQKALCPNPIPVPNPKLSLSPA